MIDSGTIITARYNDFEGEARVGLFLVLYDEKNDINTNMAGNFLACKITTQLTQSTNYVYALKKSKYSFLDKDCLITLSKLHTISLNQFDVHKHVIGKLDSDTMVKVYKEFINCIYTIWYINNSSGTISK